MRQQFGNPEVTRVRKCGSLRNATLVQDLINSYGLLLNEKIHVVESLDATEEELKTFHSSSYIDFFKRVNDIDDFDQFTEEQLEFGLAYDCPILSKSFDLVKTLAGGSISAAKILAAKKCKTAINWFGGWHHAQRDAAEGFCYVNDAVLAIQTLTRTFNKVLYIDLDIHHGNGVQNAFEYSDKILTLSFHKKSPGFYPGTGDVDDNGMAKGKYYSINVPFLEGVSHNSYLNFFSKVFDSVISAFIPNSIVVQCGADGLNGDPIGESNLTLKTIGECVERIMKCDLPTLYLGGGNWATTITTYKHFLEYGPTYELHIDQSLQRDLNTNDYINKIISQIDSYLEFIV
ncbi:hypothetical protein NQ318_000530 [Aromia moschata]|uniref:Histone deacetylase 8 n=1 Tax=Aromia moschata TaxID=1265417 RepID=A0AAV8YDU9_9CUCU|nr:hypothetical protein NQ318_000530 [Aromia moschata]